MGLDMLYTVDPHSRCRDAISVARQIDQDRKKELSPISNRQTEKRASAFVGPPSQR